MFIVDEFIISAEKKAIYENNLTCRYYIEENNISDVIFYKYNNVCKHLQGDISTIFETEIDLEDIIKLRDLYYSEGLINKNLNNEVIGYFKSLSFTYETYLKMNDLYNRIKDIFDAEISIIQRPNVFDLHLYAVKITHVKNIKPSVIEKINNIKNIVYFPLCIDDVKNGSITNIKLT